MRPMLIVSARSRREAIAADPSVRHVVVSISDPPPQSEPAKFKDRWGRKDVLRLEFCDFDPPRHDPQLVIPDFGKTVAEMSMHEGHATAIWSFLMRWWPSADNGIGAWLIHCEAGASRSPSIAKAIAEVIADRASVILEPTDKNWDAQPINRHCYSLMKRICQQS